MPPSTSSTPGCPTCAATSTRPPSTSGRCVERVAVRAASPAGVGLAGDEVVDKRHHGGRDQAVYAYAVEDRDWWAAELGRELAPGSFGQNLDTEGIDVTGAVIGERWHIGDDGLVLEVTSPRIPCATFQGFMDEPHWVKRFTEHGASGAYLRVVEEGTVGAGDRVTVTDRPAHGVTVGEVFVKRRVAAERLQQLLDEQPDLAPDLVARRPARPRRPRPLTRAVLRRLQRRRPVRRTCSPDSGAASRATGAGEMAGTSGAGPTGRHQRPRPNRPDRATRGDSVPGHDAEHC